MIHVDINKLNDFEKKIHSKIFEIVLTENNLTIINIAQICQCSTSKISKMVKKLGFNSYKEYLRFLQGKEVLTTKYSDEIQRISQFLKDFDRLLITNFINQFQMYDKIILFGYGPSYICVQYFEYKLRLISSKVIIAVDNEVAIQQVIDETTLVVIFSTTGNFKSFDSLNQLIKQQGGHLLIILEENNPGIIMEYNNVFVLTNTTQDKTLSPYEKSRTIFFIFIEEVIKELMSNKDAL